ncbi:MAG: PilZ domain-containing protein [Planctomycetes bacterium]|nr:PilZ domain-containing protein [Planctomycetota bacterium]
MANVLITDLFEESAYLVRSLLRGVGHAVSIAVSRADAEAKLSTGLFDVLVMDYGTIVDDNLAVGMFANEMLPGLPVVALTRPDYERRLKDVQLSGKFHRPIRGRSVKEAVQNALNNMFRQSQRRTAPRVHVDLPVELEIGGVSLKTKTIDLSSRGVAIDATDCKLAPEQLQAIENEVGKSTAHAAFTVEEGKVIQLTARLAFVERHRSLSGRTIGLAFEALDEESEVALSGFYNQAA